MLKFKLEAYGLGLGMKLRAEILAGLKEIICL